MKNKLIYRSLRVGKGGKPFFLYKFRTMYPHLDGGLPTASLNDHRLTPFGKWLRRLKIDELACIVNVLRGEMVIVSYRPDTPDEIASLDKKTRDLLYKFKPGVISPATIWNYKEDAILADKDNPHAYYRQIIFPVKYYLNTWYLQNKSFWLDFRVFLAYIFRYVGINPKRFNIFPRDFML